MGDATPTMAFARMALAALAMAVVASAMPKTNEVVPEAELQLQFNPTLAMARPKDDCKLDVKDCFARQEKFVKPVWQKPLERFRVNFERMCQPEIKTKATKKETREKGEAKFKELCVKNEQNAKYTEKKVKLMEKKESYTKTVAEGKEKYLEKKRKFTRESREKAIGKTKEFQTKAESNEFKHEDELYKKECVSKETAFKAVREGKEKVKIVYYHPKLVLPEPKPPPPPAPPPPPPPAPPVVQPAPVPAPIIKKEIVYVPAPAPVKHQVVVETPIHSLKETLVKNAEVTNKAQVKSSEVVVKNAANNRELLVKESLHKESRQKTRHDIVDETGLKASKKEVSCKERISKEDSVKSEIEQKLAVESVKKKTLKKEIARKAVVPKKKPCSPQSSLEKYIKSCRAQEEKFNKSKITTEQTVKEVKVKAAKKLQKTECQLSRSICDRIHSDTSIKDEKLAEMIDDHTEKLEGEMKKSEQGEESEIVTLKFDICESAHADMKYISHRLGVHSVEAGLDKFQGLPAEDDASSGFVIAPDLGPK